MSDGNKYPNLNAVRGEINAATGPLKTTSRLQSQIDYATAVSGQLRLPRLLGKLRRGEPVVIVVDGSSSYSPTGGAASTTAATFPQQLLSRLQAAYPASTITLHQIAVGGSQISNLEARFLPSVVPYNADLLIVGTGANEANNRGDSYLPEFRARFEGYLRAAREYGMDVLAMDSQYYPAYTPAMQRFNDAVEDCARAAGAQFFSRTRMMRGWVDRGEYTFSQFLWSGDNFHMIDLGYSLWADAAALAIQRAAWQDHSTSTRVSVHQGLKLLSTAQAQFATPDYGAQNTPSRTSYEAYQAAVGQSFTVSTSFVGTGIRLLAIGGPWYENATVEWRVDGGAWTTLTGLHTVERVRGASYALARNLAYGLHCVDVRVTAGATAATLYIQGWEPISRSGSGQASDAMTAIYGPARVVTGLTPTPGSGLSVSATPGEAMVLGHVMGSSQSGVGAVTLAAADATNPRIDLIVWSYGQVLSAVTGTPAASPVVPTQTIGGVLLAEVRVAAGATTSAGLTITDRRSPIRP